MKKLVVLLAAGAFAVAASADLTGWAFTGGKLYDETGAAVPAGTPAGSYSAHTVLLDLSGLVVDNGGELQIPIASINTVGGEADLAVGPVFTGGNYGTTGFASDGSIAGSTAYLVAKKGLGAIAVGDWIGLGGGGVLVDLAPGTDPPATPQSFAAGDVTTNIKVIPEPATIGLMGVAGLGMFLARKRTRR